MKGKTNKTLNILIMIILIFSLSLGTLVFASDNLEKVKGYFSPVITIFKDNQQISLGYDDVTGESYKPIMTSNNRVYIPVRAITEVLGMEVEWDGANKRVIVIEKPDASYNYMIQKITDDGRKIRELEAKIEELESKLKTEKTSISNLDEMAVYLNDEYYYYEDIRFYIYLSGNTRNINVKIFVDSKDNSRWNALSHRKIKSYISDIADDIQYSFKNASISGYFESDYTGKKIADFSIDTKGNMELDTSYANGIYDLSNMEDYLNKNFSRYEGVDFHIRLYWDLNNIRADVFVNDNEWYGLGSSKREKYLKDIIYREISWEFPYEGIYGNVYDNYYREPYTNYTIQSFEFDYNGKLYLD